MSFKQGVQALRAFAFCVLTVNDVPTKQTQVQKKTEVKHKAGIGAELRLKLQFESDQYFCDTAESGWF